MSDIYVSSEVTPAGILAAATHYAGGQWHTARVLEPLPEQVGSWSDLILGAAKKVAENKVVQGVTTAALTVVSPPAGVAAGAAFAALDAAQAAADAGGDTGDVAAAALGAAASTALGGGGGDAAPAHPAEVAAAHPGTVVASSTPAPAPPAHPADAGVAAAVGLLALLAVML